MAMIGNAEIVQTATCRKLSVETRLHGLGYRLESTVRLLVGQLILKLVLLNSCAPTEVTYESDCVTGSSPPV